MAGPATDPVTNRFSVLAELDQSSNQTQWKFDFCASPTSRGRSRPRTTSHKRSKPRKQGAHNNSDKVESSNSTPPPAGQDTVTRPHINDFPRPPTHVHPQLTTRNASVINNGQHKHAPLPPPPPPLESAHRQPILSLAPQLPVPLPSDPQIAAVTAAHRTLALQNTMSRPRPLAIALNGESPRSGTLSPLPSFRFAALLPHRSVPTTPPAAFPSLASSPVIKIMTQGGISACSPESLSVKSSLESPLPKWAQVAWSSPTHEQSPQTPTSTSSCSPVPQSPSSTSHASRLPRPRKTARPFPATPLYPRIASPVYPNRPFGALVPNNRINLPSTPTGNPITKYKAQQLEEFLSMGHSHDCWCGKGACTRPASVASGSEGGVLLEGYTTPDPETEDVPILSWECSTVGSATDDSFERIEAEAEDEEDWTFVVPEATVETIPAHTAVHPFPGPAGSGFPKVDSDHLETPKNEVPSPVGLVDKTANVNGAEVLSGGDCGGSHTHTCEWPSLQEAEAQRMQSKTLPSKWRSFHV